MFSIDVDLSPQTSRRQRSVMGSRTYVLVFVLITCAMRFSIATDCGGSSSSIEQTDLATLINDIAADNFNPPVPNPFNMPRGSYEPFTYKTAQVCVGNGEWTGIATVSLAEIANGALFLESQCCSAGVCQGGDTTINVEAGGPLFLSVHSPGDVC